MEKPETQPDCVHCRFMVRQTNGEYRCRQHDITLHSPVSLFCKQLAPQDEQDDSTYQTWFTDTLDTEQFDANTLYTWVETRTQDQQGEIQLHRDYEVIALLTTYRSWAAGTFWQVLRRVRRARRDAYREHGYDVLD